MRIIRDSLLKSHMAEEPSGSYLLYGLTMDHLTEHVLYSLSNNTGFSLVVSSSLHSYSDPSFSVAYPLSALTSREIVLYCHFKQIPFLTQLTFLAVAPVGEKGELGQDRVLVVVAVEDDLA